MQQQHCSTACSTRHTAQHAARGTQHNHLLELASNRLKSSIFVECAEIHIPHKRLQEVRSVLGMRQMDPSATYNCISVSVCICSCVCNTEECLAALEGDPYLKVGKVRKVRKLCHISEIFCIHCN